MAKKAREAETRELKHRKHLEVAQRRLESRLELDDQAYEKAHEEVSLLSLSLFSRSFPPSLPPSRSVALCVRACVSHFLSVGDGDCCDQAAVPTARSRGPQTAGRAARAAATRECVHCPLYH